MEKTGQFPPSFGGVRVCDKHNQTFGGGKSCIGCDLAIAKQRIANLEEQLAKATAKNERLTEVWFEVGEQLGYPYGEVDQTIPFYLAIARLQAELAEAQRQSKDANTVIDRAVEASQGIQPPDNMPWALKLYEQARKAEALDRLEEMRANVHFCGDIVQLVTIPYQATSKHTTRLIDAITEAYERSKL